MRISFWCRKNVWTTFTMMNGEREVYGSEIDIDSIIVNNREFKYCDTIFDNSKLTDLHFEFSDGVILEVLDTGCHMVIIEKGRCKISLKIENRVVTKKKVGHLCFPMLNVTIPLYDISVLKMKYYYNCYVSDVLLLKAVVEEFLSDLDEKRKNIEHLIAKREDDILHFKGKCNKIVEESENIDETLKEVELYLNLIKNHKEEIKKLKDTQISEVQTKKTTTSSIVLKNGKEYTYKNINMCWIPDNQEDLHIDTRETNVETTVIVPFKN